MGASRRRFLAGLGALAACRGAPEPRSRPPGALLDGALPGLAHRLGGAPSAPVRDERVDVCILGGGVAGLSAAWRLARAGFGGRVLLLELAPRLGGTAGAGQGPAGPFPLGAHYITLPSPEARHVRALLHELGVIQGFDAEGRPRYRDEDLCFAPEERLFLAGEWQEDLWPEAGSSAEDRAQRAAWQAQVAALRAWRGADGRPAFAIPLAASSQDPAVLALAGQSFAAWLAAQGYTSPRLLWTLRYACRDDYGAEPEQVSAWAGLHYHAARRPDPDRALGTEVLTWPAGNGWLVAGLAARARCEVRLGVLAQRAEPEAGGWRVWAQQGEERFGVQARYLIAALPARAVDRLLTRPAAPRPELAPWRVVQLHCDRSPASRGVPVAWDSVVYGAEGLGYVSSAHQSASYGRGPTTLSWYQPLSGQEPAPARRALLAEGWEEAAELALSELAPAHPDLLERVQSIEVVRWGHGTAIPAVGLHGSGLLAQAAAPLPGASFAHADLSGLSLFEEASGHGVRAAEEALDALGQPPTERLAPR